MALSTTQSDRLAVSGALSNVGEVRKKKFAASQSETTRGREIQSESPYKMGLIDHRFSPDGLRSPPGDRNSTGSVRPARSDATAAQVAGGAAVFGQHPPLAAVTTREVGV